MCALFELFFSKSEALCWYRITLISFINELKLHYGFISLNNVILMNQAG